MAIRFKSLDHANMPAVRELVMSIWNQDPDSPAAQALFAWRYGARPRGDTQLAFDGDRCVGIVDSLVRPYLHDGRVVAVRETCDWFCRPDYRPLGIGTVLMRRMMALPEPILSIGGSKSTLALLPRLRWQRAGDVKEYVLPLTARMLAAWGLRGLGFKAASAALVPARFPCRRLKAAQVPASRARVEPIGGHDDAPLPQPAGYAFAGILDRPNLAWLTNAPATLQDVIALKFFIGADPVGMSLSRMEPYARRRAGKILHFQIDSCPASAIDWLLAETARRLVERGAEMLLCRTCCPIVGEALRRLGFFWLQDAAVHWWSPDGTQMNGPMHLTYLRADDALPFDDLARPYATPARSSMGPAQSADQYGSYRSQDRPSAPP